LGGTVIGIVYLVELSYLKGRDQFFPPINTLSLENSAKKYWILSSVLVCPGFFVPHPVTGFIQPCPNLLQFIVADVKRMPIKTEERFSRYVAFAAWTHRPRQEILGGEVGFSVAISTDM